MALSHPESLDLTNKIIGEAIEVHRVLGPGLLESTYDTCLYLQLTDAGHTVERQRSLPVIFKSHVIPDSYRIDQIVNGQVVIEVKSVEKVCAVHKAQVLTYLRMTGMKVGLLINFNVPKLADGITRISF